MENFSLNLTSAARTTNLFPPLDHLAYNKQDYQENLSSRRQNINFGIVLSSPSGRTGYRIGNESFETTVPAFIFTCPGPEYTPLNPAPIEKLFFAYSPEHREMFRIFIDHPEYVLTPFRRDFNLSAGIDEIFHLGRNIRNPGNTDRLDACCMRLVQEIMLNLRERESGTAPYASAIYQIASYLDLHFAESPDITALAAKRGMSYRTFLRCWERIFHTTPSAGIRKRQLDEACRLLIDTDLKIYEIAEQTGFADPYYFMRIFHKTFRITPKQYRTGYIRTEIL